MGVDVDVATSEDVGEEEGLGRIRDGTETDVDSVGAMLATGAMLIAGAILETAVVGTELATTEGATDTAADGAIEGIVTDTVGSVIADGSAEGTEDGWMDAMAEKTVRVPF